MIRKSLIIGLFLSLVVVIGWSEEIYCRYELNERVFYGKVEGDMIAQLTNAPWAGGIPAGLKVEKERVRFLHPSEPQKIIGLAGSYKEAWEEGKKPFKTVRWFLKPPTSAASPGDDVILPAALDELLVETELAIVIGKRVKNADEKKAQDAIFGYTVANDIVGSVDSYHKIQGEPLDQEETLLPFALKHGDNFSPYGPFIYCGVDWNNRERTLIVSNEEKGKKEIYKHTTANLVYTPAKMVSDLSRVFVLEPGDVIFTGTSAALPAHAGDRMEVTVEGLGTIVNHVVAPQN